MSDRERKEDWNSKFLPLDDKFKVFGWQTLSLSVFSHWSWIEQTLQNFSLLSVFLHLYCLKFLEIWLLWRVSARFFSALPGLYKLRFPVLKLLSKVSYVLCITACVGEVEIIFVWLNPVLCTMGSEWNIGILPVAFCWSLFEAGHKEVSMFSSAVIAFGPGMWVKVRLIGSAWRPAIGTPWLVILCHFLTRLNTLFCPGSPLWYFCWTLLCHHCRAFRNPGPQWDLTSLHKNNL